jgi:hypothetical protein
LHFAWITPREIFVFAASLLVIELDCKLSANIEFVEKAGFKGKSSEGLRESAQ